MSTKIVILGQEPQEKELKKIEFVKYLMKDCESFNNDILGSDSPELLRQISLCPKSEGSLFDIMFCERKDGRTFYILGHFNDGIV